MGDLDPSQQQALDKARGFYVGHQGAYGAMLAPGADTMLLKSGVSGGAWGGTDRGGIPRGQGWGFTQGGPSQGNIATHVEGHAAAIMWQRGINRGVLVVSEPMCAICSRDLPSALPPGAELHVVVEGEGTTIVRSTHYVGEEIPPLTPAAGGAGSPPNGAGTPRPGGSNARADDDEELNKRPRGSRAPDDDPTPGFNQAGIQNVGNALALLQHWASQISMMRTAYDAWNEVLDRKSEIVQTQNDNPLFPVYIIIYWHVQFDNNPNMPQIYEYVGADILSGAAGPPVALRAAGQHTYLMTIPALKTDTTKKPSGAPRTWRDGYQSVVGLLEGDHFTGGDPVAALRVLNGSPMYDILPILQTLKASDPRNFDKLQQAIAWPDAGVNGDRLRAAFFAVELSGNSGNDAFPYYKSACKEFNTLPEDQQKDVENFLSGKSGPERKVVGTPEGEWTVRVSRWTWVYTFSGNAVTWRDPYNGENGKGKWRQLGGKITIDWSPSKSTDTWYLPLDPANQKGMAHVDGEGTFPVAATRN